MNSRCSTERSLLHRQWASLRDSDIDRRELYESRRAAGERYPPSPRPLCELYADLRAGRPLKGRDAERVVVDSVQGRRFYAMQVPKRSSLLERYDDAISAGEAEAQHHAAAEEAQRRWSVDHDEAPEAHDIGWQLVLEASCEAVEQAVRRRNVKPPPWRIVGLWQADADGKWQLIADHRGEAAPNVEQPQGPTRDRRRAETVPDV